MVPNVKQVAIKFQVAHLRRNITDIDVQGCCDFGYGDESLVVCCVVFSPWSKRSHLSRAPAAFDEGMNQ